MNNNIEILSDREHVLKRPAMYIGAVDLTDINDYVIDNSSIKEETLKVVPGLLKIINEIIDNSVDNAIKTNFKECNTITVNIDNHSVEIKDNGTGIPVIKTDDGYMPELAWGRMRSGSNFDDNNRTQIGMNGVGSFCTNCFSTKFIGISDDGKQRCVCSFSNNAESCTTKITNSKERGVTVKFYPDLARFNLTEIDSNHIKAIHQRLINLGLSFPLIKFKFNNKNVSINSFKKFIKMFDTNAEIEEHENYSFAIMHNPNDDFRQFSYVNGLKIPDGGTHIDVIANSIVNRLRDKLIKKYKTIKPGDIKNKLFIVAFLKNFNNCKFNSQSKEKITNSIAEVNNYYGNIDYDNIVKNILKNESIIEPITEIYKIKEELKRRQELKSLNKPKKIKNDKYLPPIKNHKYLMIVEGECLEENTKVLMSDYSSKAIKDIKVGDILLDKNYNKTVVQAITKSLKETLTFKTKSLSFTCGYNHKIYAYDTDTKSFKFIEAYKLIGGNYKIVKSNINESTYGIKVIKNDYVNKILLCDENTIYYTDNDYFIVIDNGVVIRKSSHDIKPDDIILSFKDL